MLLPRLGAVFTALCDPRRWRKWALEALIFLAIVVGLSVWQNRGLPEGAAPPLQGIRTDGVQVNIVGDAGTISKQGKATLVVFWATWCPVCRAEAGNIEAIAGEWPVISMVMQSGDATAIRKHLKEHSSTLSAEPLGERRLPLAFSSTNWAGSSMVVGVASGRRRRG